ncbi:hypothetical protein GIB67_020623 [Kingdonia uniflora]|uniref:Uncharacterized protein n=1 Tax=Kingdonia uniflora TaxID=39325 RepID=A0A7J7M8T0_9MAGN|nr:hypothetical protein GIB67_020623 [Kingdonia uniflora]
MKAHMLNEVGQVVGDKSTKFSTRIREIAREHILIYFPTWKGVSNDTKMLIWKSLSNEYELPLPAKDQILIGANIAWKNKKYELRKVYDKSEDPETARTDFFLASHTCFDGSFLTPFLKAKVAEIKSNVEKNLESKHYDVDDNSHARAIIKEGKLAYKEINNKLNVVIDEVKNLKENTTREAFDWIGTCLDELEEDCQDVRDATNRCNEILYCTSEHSSKGCISERILQADPEVSENEWKRCFLENGWNGWDCA